MLTGRQGREATDWGDGQTFPRYLLKVLTNHVQYVCMSGCECVRVCVCACVCKREKESKRMCVCLRNDGGYYQGVTSCRATGLIALSGSRHVSMCACMSVHVSV